MSVPNANPLIDWLCGYTRPENPTSYIVRKRDAATSHYQMGGGQYGKMLVPDEEYAGFLESMAEGLAQPVPQIYSVIERRTPYFRLMFDLDFQQDSEVSLLELQGYMVTITTVIQKFFGRSSNRHFWHIVCASPCKELADGRIKTGFHVVYPNIYVNSDQALDIRSYCLHMLRRSVEDGGHGDRTGQDGNRNSWEDVVDEAIYNANGFRMLYNAKYHRCVCLKNKSRSRTKKKNLDGSKADAPAAAAKPAFCQVCRNRGFIYEGRAYEVQAVWDQDCKSLDCPNVVARLKQRLAHVEAPSEREVLTGTLNDLEELAPIIRAAFERQRIALAIIEEPTATQEARLAKLQRDISRLDKVYVPLSQSVPADRVLYEERLRALRLTSIRSTRSEVEPEFLRPRGAPPYASSDAVTRRNRRKGYISGQRVGGAFGVLGEEYATVNKWGKERLTLSPYEDPQRIYPRVRDFIRANVVEAHNQPYDEIDIDRIFYTVRKKGGARTYYIRVGGVGSGYCMNLGRDHKSNSIYFMIDKKGCRQRCFCTCSGVKVLESRIGGVYCKSFASKDFPLPENLKFSLFPNDYHSERNRVVSMNASPAEKNEATAFSLLSKLEYTYHNRPPPKPEAYSVKRKRQAHEGQVRRQSFGRMEKYNKKDERLSKRAKMRRKRGESDEADLGRVAEIEALRHLMELEN